MRRAFLLLALLSGLGLAPSFAATVDQEAVARKLINSQGCKACHPFEDNGGNAAPELRDPENPLTASEVRRQLQNASQRHANGQIPDFRHLRPAEIDALVDFLALSPPPGRGSD